MIFKKVLSTKLAVLIILVFELVITKKIRISEEFKPKRDYRPSKWIANSALDVWYGNRSVVDVFSRELNDIISKIAMRPGKSVLCK